MTASERNVARASRQIVIRSYCVEERKVMIQHTTSVHVQRPIEDVFAFIADGHNLTTWQHAVLEHEDLSEGPLGVGSRFREVRHVNGKPTEILAHITAYEANKRFATYTETEPLVTVRYEFASEHGGTRVDYTFVMETHGVMRVMEPLIARSIKKGASQDFETLKQVLEQ